MCLCHRERERVRLWCFRLSLLYIMHILEQFIKVGGATTETWVLKKKYDAKLTWEYLLLKYLESVASVLCVCLCLWQCVCLLSQLFKALQWMSGGFLPLWAIMEDQLLNLIGWLSSSESSSFWFLSPLSTHFCTLWFKALGVNMVIGYPRVFKNCNGVPFITIMKKFGYAMCPCLQSVH